MLSQSCLCALQNLWEILGLAKFDSFYPDSLPEKERLLGNQQQLKGLTQAILLNSLRQKVRAIIRCDVGPQVEQQACAVVPQTLYSDLKVGSESGNTVPIGLRQHRPVVQLAGQASQDTSAPEHIAGPLSVGKPEDVGGHIFDSIEALLQRFDHGLERRNYHGGCQSALWTASKQLGWNGCVAGEPPGLQ